MGLDDLIKKENENLKSEILSKIKSNKDLYETAKNILTKNDAFFADKKKAFCANKLVSEFVFEESYRPKYLDKENYESIISNYGGKNGKK